MYEIYMRCKQNRFVHKRNILAFCRFSAIKLYNKLLPGGVTEDKKNNMNFN